MSIRERVMLAGSIILLGVIVFYYLIYTPMSATYRQLAEQRDAATQELKNDEQILAGSAQVEAEYAGLSSSVKTMEARLPSTKEIPALLTGMEQLTKRIGVDFVSIRPSTPKPLEVSTQAASRGGPGQAGAGAPAGAKPEAQHVQQMDIDLNITGTFGQTETYLRELQRFPRLITVQSITLSPQTAQAGSTKLGVSLHTDAYILAAPSTAAPGKGR